MTATITPLLLLCIQLFVSTGITTAKKEAFVPRTSILPPVCPCNDEWEKCTEHYVMQPDSDYTECMER